MEPTGTTPAVIRRPRALHLIDLENLVGAVPTDCTDGTGGHGWLPGFRKAAEATLADYRTRVGIQPGDHAHIALSTVTAPAVVGLNLQGFQLRVAPAGPDAADQLLLDAGQAEYTAHRFSLLIIASGDHIFAPLAAQVTALGVPAWLVTGNSLTSYQLVRTCPIRTRLLAPVPAPVPIVAA